MSGVAISGGYNGNWEPSLTVFKLVKPILLSLPHDLQSILSKLAAREDKEGEGRDGEETQGEVGRG